MSFQLAVQQDIQILTLQGAITIRDASDLTALLHEGLRDGLPLNVATQGLEDIDTSGLQILCSLRKTVAAFSFTDPSEVLVRAVERCGLRRELLGAREGL